MRVVAVLILTMSPLGAEEEEAGGGGLPFGIPQGPIPAVTGNQVAFYLILLFGAIGTGAILAYHPLYRSKVASLEEMDLPKITITYTVVGALAGIIVTLMPAMAFAIFGIGGLMRFRTDLQSAKETGRMILATLIGMLWGLQLWNLALAMTAVAWLLILVVDWRVGYRMVVRGLDRSTLAESATAYQQVLEERGCKVTWVKKNLEKKQVSIVFKASRQLDRQDLEGSFDERVDEGRTGTIDWPQEG